MKGVSADRFPVLRRPSARFWRQRTGRTSARGTVALDDALTALAEMDPRKGQVVELRLFGGSTSSRKLLDSIALEMVVALPM